MKFFSKKVVLIIITVVVVASGVLMGFLLNRKPKFPILSVVPAAISVSGNGGPAVQVDNYLYFVDGYVDAAAIEYKQNDYYRGGEMQAGSIYRVNLLNGKQNGESRMGVPDYVYDNYNYEADDGSEYTEATDAESTDGTKHYNRTIKQTLNVEKVVPKIAGHSATALWVYNDSEYGDILIYTTPNDKMNKTGVLQSAKLDFFRVKLNGDEHEKIYTTETDSLTAASFAVVWQDGRVYIMINDGGSLKRVGMSGKKNVETVTDGIANAVFPKVTNYKKGDANTSPAKSFSGVMEYVYYTKVRDEDHTDNVMYRYHIADNKAEVIASNSGVNNGRTYTPLLAADGRFLFTAAEPVGGSAVTKLYMSSRTTDSYASLNVQQNETNTLAVGDVSGGFPALSGVKFYLSTENTGRNTENPNATARILALYNATIHVCTVSGNRINFSPTVFKNADDVVLVTAGYVYYKSGTTVSICNYSGDSKGGNVDVSNQNSMPLSVIQPVGKNGEILRGDSFLVYKLTDAGIYLLDSTGYAYEIAIKEKDNTPVPEPVTDETATDGTTTGEQPATESAPAVTE